MSGHDPNGSDRRSSRRFDAYGSRGGDDRRGFGAPWSDPGARRLGSDLDSTSHSYGSQDWDPGTRDDEEDGGTGEATAPRRRRGAGEASPYPRHPVAALGSKTRVVRDR